MVLLSATTPLRWEAHFRGWIGEDNVAATAEAVTAGAGTTAVAAVPPVGPGVVGGVGDQQQLLTAPIAPPTVPFVEIVPDPLAWEEWDMQASQKLSLEKTRAVFGTTPSGFATRRGDCDSIRIGTAPSDSI